MTEQSRNRTGKLGRICAGILLPLLGLSACVPSGPAPVPTNTPIRPTRAFTVATTDRITVTDPAAMVDQASTIVAANVFQRLMTAEPGGQALKPDVARDCRVDTPMSYLCTLPDGLTFANGHPLTSSDVKFSIERALRLNVAGSSTTGLESIRTIETPDALTVRFILSRADTQFGWAIASPAASIVDEELYDPDQIRPATQSMMGSGPYQVSFFNDEQLQLSRNPSYRGPLVPGIEALTLRRFEDSASIETAMQQHQVDAVWRGLSQAAVTRFNRQIAEADNQRTESGFSATALPGGRVRFLAWNPERPLRTNTAVRVVVAGALQEDRILDSLVPTLVPGHVSAFQVGAGSIATVTWQQRIPLTLAYDPAAPDMADLANQIRNRLEMTGGLSVQLVRSSPADSANTDLRLIDARAWTDTAMSWLQLYLQSPLQPATVAPLLTTIRETRDPAALETAVGDLQRRAANDLVILPLTESDESVYVAEGYGLDPNRLGPNHQLGLWGFRTL